MTTDHPPSANSGHGHVFPRADGMRARCGGPTVCGQCARDAAAQARVAEARGGDDELVTVTRGTLRRWAWMLDDSDGGGRSAFPEAVSAVEQGIRAVLAANAPELGRRTSSPDPEGAEATVLAPDSDTAREAGGDAVRRSAVGVVCGWDTACPACGYVARHPVMSAGTRDGFVVACERASCQAEWNTADKDITTTEDQQ